MEQSVTTPGVEELTSLTNPWTKLWKLLFLFLLIWTVISVPPFSPFRDLLGYYVYFIQFLIFLCLTTCAISAGAYSLRSFRFPIYTVFILASGPYFDGRLSQYAGINIFAVARVLMARINIHTDCNKYLSSQNICVFYSRAYDDGDYIIAKTTGEGSISVLLDRFPSDTTRIKRMMRNYYIIFSEFPYKNVGAISQ